MFAKQMLLACLLLSIIPQYALCSEVNVQDLMSYNKWRFSNKRQYMNDEEQVYRQSVFFETLKKIADHAQNKEATYSVGLNQFSDMTDEEYGQRVLNNNFSAQTSSVSKRTDDIEISHESPRGQAPQQSVDWRNKGIITPVKNQGQCGSCWTFSAAGVLESVYALKNGKQTLFSEQQILDCVNQYSGYRSSGCQGGFPEDAFNYVKKNGILTSAEYPYVGVQGRCRVTAPTKGFYPTNYSAVAQSSVALKAALAIAPVSVAVDASKWNYYSGGVYNGCGQYTYQNQLNHAVVAVGYDAQGNWIIKNSYGTTWGEKGFIRLAPGNQCGVLYHNYQIAL